MSCMRIVCRGHAVILLENEKVYGRYGKEPEDKRQKYSLRALNKQLLPVTLSDGKVHTHARYEKQKGYSPDVQHRHWNPYSRHDLLTSWKSYKHSPRLKNNRDVIDQQKPYCNHA